MCRLMKLKSWNVDIAYFRHHVRLRSMLDTLKQRESRLAEVIYSLVADRD